RRAPGGQERGDQGRAPGRDLGGLPSAAVPAVRAPQLPALAARADLAARFGQRESSERVIEGIGVHSGRGCRVRLERTDGPVRFRRGRALIPARVGAVVGTEGCPVLGAAAARVAMVEHLLAALRVRGFWSGVLIEASSDELPILDGSAAPWLALLDELGPPPPPPEPLV